MICEICGLYGCDCSNGVKRLADRIAKLEAAVTKFSAAAETEPVATEPKATPAAAGPVPPGYKLAPGWGVLETSDVDGTCSIPAHGRRAVYGNRKAMESACDVECAKRLGALVKVEPSAEQPVSAADGLPVTYYTTKPVATTITETVPPAPAQGAPAEPLSARLAPWADGKLSTETLDVRSLREKVVALEARLAAAERLATADREENARLKAELSVLTSERDLISREYEEMNQQRQRLCRDIAEAHEERNEALVSVKQAVAAERERCLYHVETYEPRRDVPDDWSYQGALSRIADAISDGRQAK